MSDFFGSLLAKQVASGAATTLLRAGSGKLARVVITVAGTGAANVLFVDSATTTDAAASPVIGTIPATIVVPSTGSIAFDIPYSNGLCVINVANGPAMTVSYY